MTDATRTWLSGGLVVDGSGAPARRADVLLAEGHVASVGEIPPADRKGAVEVDCGGLVVAPEPLVQLPRRRRRVRAGGVEGAEASVRVRCLGEPPQRLAVEQRGEVAGGVGVSRAEAQREAEQARALGCAAGCAGDGDPGIGQCRAVQVGIARH